MHHETHTLNQRTTRDGWNYVAGTRGGTQGLEASSPDTRGTNEPNRKIVQIDARADILVRTGVYKALALVGAAVIPTGGFLAAADWSDYWMHDCYAVGGCSGIALPTVSAISYITPWLLMALVGLVLASAGLRRLSGVTRTRYIVWSVLVGLVVLMGLYSYLSWVMWMVPPPGGASTTTSTTTVK